LQTFDRLVEFANDPVDGDIRYIYAETLKHRETGIRTLELASPDVFPVASPDLIEKFSFRIRDACDLLQAPLIEERDQSEWERWLTLQGCSDRPTNRVGRYGQAHLTIAAARAGQGVALTNLFLAADDLLSGRLVRVVPSERGWQNVKLGSYVFQTTTSKWDDYRVRRFRNWLVDEFRQAQIELTNGNPPPR
jgi:DNA-binding transcriptional LysR family regulator